MTWLIQTERGDICAPCLDDYHTDCDGDGCECVVCVGDED